MKTRSVSFVQRTVVVLSSNGFFWVILGWFVLQAAWIALSGRYPMAFDEDFHLGIIRLYAHHISPFWGTTPAGSVQYGAIARDPSYLYHYLMSFPYRLLSLLTGDQTIQVIVLRFMNIGMFAAGLMLFRRLLLKTGASRGVVHACLFAFVCIPIVPLLAAQINYDNLLFPAVALTLLLCERVNNRLGHGKKLDIVSLIELLIACFLASLVKYAFLPIFAVVVAYIGIRLWQTYGSWSVAKRHFKTAFMTMSRRSMILLFGLLVITAFLFGQRYGVNVVRYHTPLPSCDKVLSVAECSQYPPWYRDYQYSLNKIPGSHTPTTYAADWSYGIWLRTFFAVDGPGTRFQTRGPLLLPALFGMIVPAASVMLIIVYGRRVLRRYNAALLWLFVAVATGYVAALWLDGYQSFLATSRPVAINGRYLVPVFLPLMMLAALSLSVCLRERRDYKLVAAVILTGSLLWGGGALTYVLRSNNGWYWPNDLVTNVNHQVRDAVGPIVPGYYSPSEFLH